MRLVHFPSFVLDRVLLCNPGWTGLALLTSQPGLDLVMILLPLPLQSEPPPSFTPALLAELYLFVVVVDGSPLHAACSFPALLLSLWATQSHPTEVAKYEDCYWKLRP